MNLPQYRCHKIVGAVQIFHLWQDGHSVDFWIQPQDVTVPPFLVERAYIDRCNPKPGGYFVQYEDGYQSYSPAKAFEAGYTRMAERIIEIPRTLGVD